MYKHIRARVRTRHKMMFTSESSSLWGSQESLGAARGQTAFLDCKNVQEPRGRCCGRPMKWGHKGAERLELMADLN